MKAKIIGNTPDDDYYHHYLEVGDIVGLSEDLGYIDEPDVFDVICIEGSKPGLPQCVRRECIELL